MLLMAATSAVGDRTEENRMVDALVATPVPLPLPRLQSTYMEARHRSHNLHMEEYIRMNRQAVHIVRMLRQGWLIEVKDRLPSRWVRDASFIP